LSLSPARLTGELQADVVVLGGGLAGLAAALELARPGRRVAVLEAVAVGAGPSGADLGHVVTGPELPYTRAIDRFGSDPARTLWELSGESHDLLRDRLKVLGDDCGYRRNGGFVLARDRAEATALADSEDALRDHGFGGEFLDHYMVEARFDVRGFAAAYWAADDGEVEPVALLRALAAHAVTRGVALFEGSAVVELTAGLEGVHVRTAHGSLRAAAGVVALGAQTVTLVPSVAPALASFEALRLVSSLAAGPALPSPARTADGAFGWRMGSDFRAAVFGSPTSEAASDSPAPSFESLAFFLGSHLPSPPHLLGRFSGMLATTPDGLPLVGPVPGSPLVVMAGLGKRAHSWAFLAARWVADVVAGKPESVPLLFRASRFECKRTE
jgi:gamma-glutamylputrescine oxidase